MKRGRRPKPTAIKLLEGNPGKRALNLMEPASAADVGGAPVWLSPEARACWQEVAGTLAPGVLQRADRHALEHYCRTYEKWRIAEAMVKNNIVAPVRDRKGRIVGIKRSAAQVEATALGMQLATMRREFGMTPSARSGITVSVEGQIEEALETKIYND